MTIVLQACFFPLRCYQACSALDLQDNRRAMQLAEEKTKNMSYVPRLFEEYSEVLGIVGGALKTYSDNEAASPTHIENKKRNRTLSFIQKKGFCNG